MPFWVYKWCLLSQVSVWTLVIHDDNALSVVINTDLIPLHSSEKWMDSPAMLHLNPTGGFALLKYHMRVAHNVDMTRMPAFTALIRSISERTLYDHLQDEVRWLFHLSVESLLFLVTRNQSLLISALIQALPSKQLCCHASPQRPIPQDLLEETFC